MILIHSKRFVICCKQCKILFPTRRQRMLTLVSNSKNFCSASSSFRLSIYQHKAFFSVFSLEGFEQAFCYDRKRWRHFGHNVALHSHTTKKGRTIIRSQSSPNDYDKQQNTNVPPFVQNSQAFASPTHDEMHGVSMLVRMNNHKEQ